MSSAIQPLRSGAPWFAMAGLLVLIAASMVSFSTLSASSEREQTQALGGSERYLGHVSTDKPIYRRGETVWTRAFVLNAFDRSPLTFDGWSGAQLEIISPRGDSVFQQHVEMIEGVPALGWRIPDDLAGGEYTARWSFPNHGFPVAERKFDIRAYRAPRLRTQIEFLRDAYGAGDQVQAIVSVSRAEGGIPEKAVITAIARIEGEEVWRGPCAIDAKGKALASFTLPAELKGSDANLVFVIEDGGVVESAAKTLPLVLKTLELNAYPEGGDLVAGLPTRIYIEASLPNGEPASVEGEILVGKGGVTATVATSHEGRGVSSLFTPKQGESYRLRITKPASIEQVIELPEVKATGASLRATKHAYSNGEAITLDVAAATAGSYRVSLARMERSVADVFVSLNAAEVRSVQLTPPASAEGVLRATVYDADDKPLAERLIFRRPMRELKLEIATNRDGYVPGDIAQVAVTVRDHRGNPVPNAIVALTVTDDSVLQMVDKRKQAPRLPQMALLEAEVESLEDAHVYLGTDTESEVKLDLLLGTQGWRRFAFRDPAEFAQAHGDAAKRIFAQREQMMIWANAAMEGMEDGAAGGMPAPAENARGAREKGAVKDDVDDKRNDENHGDPDKLDKPGAEAGEEPGEIPPAEPAADPRADKDAQVPEPEEAEKEVADRDEMRRIRPRPQPQVVREYAHKLRKNRKPGDRVDFAETLYWSAGQRSDKDGVVSFRVELSDSVTSFRVMADAVSTGGQLGSVDHLITAKEPFYIEAKIPLEVSAGDTISLPVSIANGTGEALEWKIMPHADQGLTIMPGTSRGDDTVGSLEHFGRVEADSRARTLIGLHIGALPGDITLTLTATAGNYSDKLTRAIRVVPRGFPIAHDTGGMIDAESKGSFSFGIPANVQPGSVRASVKVMPSPVANLTQALEALIREPYGCFEQTSSVVYPMVMAQQYFKSHIGVDAALIARANTHIDSGYKKLVGFECKDGGFEWFGGSPGHEALTAYGVLEFMDMAQVYDVDQAMLDRTRQWLLDQRDGQGGFKRNPRALDSFGSAPIDTTNAYIVWALTAKGEHASLKAEIEAVVKQAHAGNDAYITALAAATLHNIGRNADALPLLEKLKEHQDKDGRVTRARASITNSSGSYLDVETTAIASIAWMGNDQFVGQTEAAMGWLVETCKNGRFGSTQGTVLALKAIIAYDKARATPKAPGELTLLLNGEVVGSASFTADSKDAIELPGIAERLTMGDWNLELLMADGSRMPYTMHIEYFAEVPASAPASGLAFTTSLSAAQVSEGEGVEVTVNVKNLSPTGVGMTTAIVGLPGGLEVRVDQLKELVQAGRIAYFELNGREVILYWRALQANEVVDLKLDCIASVPGKYDGPASRAYLYYGGDQREWNHPLSVVITPRK